MLLFYYPLLLFICLNNNKFNKSFNKFVAILRQLNNLILKDNLMFITKIQKSI